MRVARDPPPGVARGEGVFTRLRGVPGLILVSEKSDIVARGINDLEWMLDYEMRSAMRYRRFLSLVVIATEEPGNLHGFLRDTVRGSDEVFQLDSGAAVLMGETERSGALKAVERLQRATREMVPLRFAVNTFLFDGHTVAELLGTAQRRLEKARRLEPNAVVSTG